MSLTELNPADSNNQVLTILRSGRETEVVQTYGKKAADDARKGAEAAEEPIDQLTVSFCWRYLREPLHNMGSQLNGS